MQVIANLATTKSFRENAAMRAFEALSSVFMSGFAKCLNLQNVPKVTIMLNCDRLMSNEFLGTPMAVVLTHTEKVYSDVYIAS